MLTALKYKQGGYRFKCEVHIKRLALMYVTRDVTLHIQVTHCCPCSL